MYTEEVTPANEIKGFTKSFQKRSKDKRVEDKDISDLILFSRNNKVVLGSKVTEKLLKRNKVQKVYVASNCNELTFEKLKHYTSINKIDLVQLKIDNEELGQKLVKPFLISVVSVRSE